MGYLARLQIIISFYTLLGIIYQMVINPFKDDESIWLFHFITLAMNLPRLFSCYLCYKWILRDTKLTR
jgi:amino acid permease